MGNKIVKERICRETLQQSFEIITDKKTMSSTFFVFLKILFSSDEKACLEFAELSIVNYLEQLDQRTAGYLCETTTAETN